MNKKSKKKMLKKIIIGLLILLIIFLSLFFTNKLITKKNDDKIKKSIDSFIEEKTDYVFLEINPKLLLIVQDGKVNNVYCMNHDCKNFYDDIHVKNLDIIEAVNQIYLLANEKKFDTSKGVKIQSTTYLPLENYDYDFIKIEYIKEEQEKQLLTEVIDYNSNDKQSNGDDYDNLLKKLETDNDYDKFYRCKNDNNKLSCYFIMDSIKTGFNLESIDIIDIDSLFSNKNDVLRILKKFNFNISKDFVKINNTDYRYSISYTHNNTKYGNILYREITEKLSDELCEYVSDSNCSLTTGIEFIKLSDINLLNPVISNDKINTISYGLKEKIIEKYNLEHQFEIEAAKREEEIKNECISKGYHFEHKTYCDDDVCVEQDMWCKQESASYYLCRENCKDID